MRNCVETIPHSFLYINTLLILVANCTVTNSLYSNTTTIYILQLFHWQSACAHFIHLCHNLIILNVKLLVLQWQSLLLVCSGKGKAFWEVGKHFWFLAWGCCDNGRRLRQNANKTAESCRKVLPLVPRLYQRASPRPLWYCLLVVWVWESFNLLKIYRLFGTFLDNLLYLCNKE